MNVLSIDVEVQGRVIREIVRERERQEELKNSGKFLWTCADPAIANPRKLAVLAEEFGEARQGGHGGDHRIRQVRGVPPTTLPAHCTARRGAGRGPHTTPQGADSGGCGGGGVGRGPRLRPF